MDVTLLRSEVNASKQINTLVTYNKHDIDNFSGCF